ncbi:MAG: energy transducer TonB [Methyloglobulus sp.]|nr:energy transducer TonB [Methyloglobulus sp.]
MNLFFVESQHRTIVRFPSLGLAWPIRWRRAIAVALVTVLVCALHCLLMVRYASLPSPAPIREDQPKPLPMIGIALEAPTGAMAKVKPEETKPTLPEPKVKITKKFKPNPTKDKPKSAFKKRVAKLEEQANAPESQAHASPIQRRAVAGANPDSDSPTSQTGVVTPTLASAEYLQNPKPHYPGIARSRHWQGVIQLRVYVTPDGLCGELSLLKSSGHDELDQAAMEAVRAWKFVPSKLGDTPVPSWVTVPIEFYLRDV